MHFPFHLIINFAHTKTDEVEKAAKKFFGSYRPREDRDEDEMLLGLYSEWLIYEYRQQSGSTFFAEYILKNPDHLTESELDTCTQILQTQKYSEFQIVTTKPGIYIELEDVATGQLYKIYDKLGSNNTEKKGLLRARIAKVNNKWYMVGANPLYLPMEYTPRMKKILRKELKGNPFTSRDTAQMLMQRTFTPTQIPQIPTNKELKKKRQELQSTYESLVKKYDISLSYEDLCTAVYEENRVNVLDFWQGLLKKGLSEIFMVNETQLLQDIWNYMPHRCLNGASPIELFARLSKAKQEK